MESAYAILNPQLGAPSINATQLLTSPAALQGACGGGRPADALAYLAEQGQQGQGLEGAYAGSQVSSLFPVVSFDSASFYGWFGILLAVQRQPVIVHIEATASSFVNYDGVGSVSSLLHPLNHIEGASSSFWFAWSHVEF